MDDERLLSILGLLYGDDRPALENIRVVSSQDYPGSKSDTTQPKAWARSNDPNIYLDRGHDIYKLAMSGNKNAQKALAGILGHEQFHKRVTMDEGPAYEKELEILKSLRASGSELSRVRMAQRHVDPNYRVLKSKPFNSMGYLR